MTQPCAVASRPPAACRAPLQRKPPASGSWRAAWRPRAPVTCAAAETEEATAATQAPSIGTQLQPAASGRLAAGGKRVAVLQASKSASWDVQEAGRPLAEYMCLPASQYSVLDAKRIERLDEDTFRCYVGGLKLFSLEVEPVITVSVTVQERGPTVRLLSTKLKGSKAVEAANERFDATMTNAVRWEDAPGGGKQLASDTFLQVQLQVPGWFVLPTSTIERTGSAVMARVLETAVPRFLQQLALDYAAWAAGDDSRQPVGSGELSLVPEDEAGASLAAAASSGEQGWE